MRVLVAVQLLFLVGCSGGAARRDVRPAAPRADVASVSSTPTFEAHEEEVTFDAAGRTIHGTLATPVAGGRRPALMMIAGSGPTDRDWNSPLLPGRNGSAHLLALELARRGLVVLRYDKLGTGATRATATLSWPDYVAEQRAAHAFLRAHAAVDPERIFLAGHSEGGVHALHLLEQPGEQFAGLVMLSAPGRRMSDVIVAQLEGQFRRAGVTGAALEATMAPMRRGIAAFLAGQDVDPRTVSDIPPVQQLFASIFAPDGAAFARAIFAYDPAAAIGRVRIPIVVLNGGRDAQVSPDLDARPLADAARHGGNRAVTIHIAPEADHVLKHQPIPVEQLDPSSTTTGYNSEGRVIDPDLLAALVGWLAEQTAPSH